MIIVTSKTKAICGIIIIKKESEASHNEKSIIVYLLQGGVNEKSCLISIIFITIFNIM